MKRIKIWLPLLLTLALLLAACGAPAQEAETASEEITPDFFNGKTAVMPATPVELTPEMVEAAGGVRPGEILAVPSLNEAMTALRGGRADMLLTLRPTAELFCGADSTLAYLTGAAKTGVTMLTRAEDTDLTERINAAIDELDKEGVADALLTEMTEKLLSGELATADEPEPLEGEETIRIGVSGDLPPLDYISYAGKPVGFSAAYMREVAKLMGAKVEFVEIPTPLKFSALLSGRIDVFFWHAQPTLGEGIAATNAYYEADGALVYLAD